MLNRRRAFTAVVATTLLLGIAVAVPSFAAKPPAAKTFGMEVTTNAPPSGGWVLGSGKNANPANGSVHTAPAGSSSTFYAWLVNTSPGNSNPNSFLITAPAGFTVTGASLYASNNVNAGAAVNWDASNAYVTGLDPLKNYSSSGQYVTIAITATAPGSGSCGTSSTASTWTAVGYTGSSLSGDPFSQNTGDARTNLSLSCSLRFNPAPVGATVGANIPVTVEVVSGSTVFAGYNGSITLSVSGPASVSGTGTVAASDGAASFTLNGGTAGDYVATATATGISGSITADFTLYSDGIFCDGDTSGLIVDPESDTTSKLDRTDPGPESGCIEVPYTLTVTRDLVTLLKDQAIVDQQGAQFRLTITWGVPADDYQLLGATTTTFDLDGNFSSQGDQFVPNSCEVVDGEAQYPINPDTNHDFWPAGDAEQPWCSESVSQGPAPGGDYMQVTETFLGSGDPSIRRS